jgi:hypothetical protein
MAHFTDDQIDAFERRFEVKRPAVPETSDPATFENVESFTEAPTEIGLRTEARRPAGSTPMATSLRHRRYRASANEKVYRWRPASIS